MALFYNSIIHLFLQYLSYNIIFIFGATLQRSYNIILWTHFMNKKGDGEKKREEFYK